MVGFFERVRQPDAHVPNFSVTDCDGYFERNFPFCTDHFKRKVHLQEQKAQQDDRFLCRRQIVYVICRYFLVTEAMPSIKEVELANLFGDLETSRSDS